LGDEERTAQMGRCKVNNEPKYLGGFDAFQVIKFRKTVIGKGNIFFIIGKSRKSINKRKDHQGRERFFCGGSREEEGLERRTKREANRREFCDAQKHGGVGDRKRIRV